MKKIIVVSILASISFIATAQEIGEYNKKGIKKELRGFLKKPESYYKQKVDQAKTVKNLNKNVAELTTRVSKLNSEIKELKLDLEAAQKHILNLRNLSSYAIDGNYEYYPLKVFTSTGEFLDQAKFDKNIQYHVQVASLNNPSYSKPSNLYADVKENFDGKNYVYDVDGFNDPDLAYEYAMFLRENKIVPDAFVTKYVKGQRDFNYKYDNNTVIFVQKSQAAANQLTQPPVQKNVPTQVNKNVYNQYKEVDRMNKPVPVDPATINHPQVIQKQVQPVAPTNNNIRPQNSYPNSTQKNMTIENNPADYTGNQPDLDSRTTPIKVFDNRDEVERQELRMKNNVPPMDVPKVQKKTVPYNKGVNKPQQPNQSQYIHDAPPTPVAPADEFYHEIDPKEVEEPANKVIKQPSSGGMMIIE